MAGLEPCLYCVGQETILHNVKQESSCNLVVYMLAEETSLKVDKTYPYVQLSIFVHAYIFIIVIIRTIHMLKVLHYHDCAKIEISIIIMKNNQSIYRLTPTDESAIIGIRFSFYKMKTYF